VPKIVEDALLIYTDGSLYPKGRKGGYGVVFIHVDPVGIERLIAEHAPPGIRGTTGNRMELHACIDALEMARDMDVLGTVTRVVIRTDSKYIANNYRYALGSWRGSGWTNQQGRPIENADLWKDFARAFKKLPKQVRFEWIKGHGKGTAKDVHNVRADRLAKESAKNPLSRPVFHSSVRHKLGSAHTKRGSITVAGQTMAIFIVEVKRMRVQRTWQYRYQVASRNSPDYHAIDWIYSDEQMRDGRYYEVRVNDDMGHPQILEVIREISAAELGS
jgi:ribonuclease HI